MATIIDSKLCIELEPQKQLTEVVPKNATKPITLAALKRPLSAYNIYFQMESKRLIKGESVRAFTINDAIKICDEQRMIRSLPKATRKCRKAHGKFPFEHMARVIADSWKALDHDTRKVFEDCAALEKKRYVENKKSHTTENAAKGGEASPVAERKVVFKESEDMLSTWSMLDVEDEKLLSEILPAIPSVSEYQNLVMDDLQPIGYKQTGQKDEYDVFDQTHQNLMCNLTIIKERQTCLQQMEHSLKSMIKRHLKSQQIGNWQRRKSNYKSLKARKIDQRMTSMKPCHNSAIMKNEGLGNKIPLQSYGHGSIQLNMNECFDNVYGGLEDVDASIFALTDDVFNRADNPIFCNSIMNNEGLCDVNDCFHSLFSGMGVADDSINDVENHIFNSADYSILSSSPMMNNEGFFSKLTNKSHGQGSIDLDMNDSFNSSNGVMEDVDNFVIDLAGDIFNVADDKTMSSSYMMSKYGLFHSLPMQGHGRSSIYK